MTNFTDALKTLIREAVQEGIRAERSQNGAAETKRLLTVEETAIRLALSKDEVYNMIATEDLACVRRGRRLMLDIRDVDRWIERNKQGRANGSR